jgi:hypothetical protein
MTTRLILLALAFLVIAVLLRPKHKSGGWKVYGTMECGWTRKQLDHMKKKGINHTFVNCSSENCPGVNAFPTMIHPQSGETIVGYKEI